MEVWSFFALNLVAAICSFVPAKDMCFAICFLRENARLFVSFSQKHLANSFHMCYNSARYYVIKEGALVS